MPKIATRRKRLARAALTLWDEGWSIREICAELDTNTKALHKAVPVFPSREWVEICEAARQSGVGSQSIRRWIELKLVPDSPSGLVKVAEVALAKAALLARLCENPKCGKAIGRIDTSAVHCTSCARKARRYDYPFLPAEKKAKRHSATAKWQAGHPERTRLIELRANLVYSLVHRQGVDRAEARRIANKRFPLPPLEKTG